MIEYYIKVPLTQGKFALVDLEDYLRIKEYKWYALKSKSKKSKKFYWHAETYINGRLVSMPMFLIGKKEGFIIDHKNGDSLDNRKSNLRHCTYSQNSQNSRAIGKHSKYKGVTWNKSSGKWETHICIAGVIHWLGYFEDEKYAAKVYDAYADKLFGEFAKLNFNVVNKKLFKPERLIKRKPTSKYRGVSFDKRVGNYRVYVGTKYLGRFKTESDGALAYNKYVIENNIGYKLNTLG